MKYSTAQWESLCDQCGRCCYEKYDYRGQIFYTETPCKFLNLHTKKCRVYNQRQQAQPECATLSPDLVRAGILPPDCPYVKKLDTKKCRPAASRPAVECSD